MAMLWPDHLLTLADWDDLPENNERKIELAEGVLAVSPRPTSIHQRVIIRLATQLNSQLPAELEALGEVEVVIEETPPPTVRIPDVCVVPALDDAVVRWDATDVLLAVEILSPGTRRTDRITKFAEYAEAGIEHYWLVDIEAPASITAYRLVADQYKLIADTSAPTAIELAGTQLIIDPTTLLTTRR
ncbi:hypothetical protein NN3_20560 [Nocardia neocaledoniensis NBRC 108232]|uniref:Uma2 family endonuclease n=1 Tax=Nocardia neocaledoniensis TaxID=236511 RepID=A0A317NSE3_9NOCA|nr:Uma2 family endonuclease [Nocardia neocaledoniensis]PWV77803.1 Uma2 family endonuclease [Nocardia neocaledoniensis]GEM31049.1 hypothetical protein NN3_20560 [Nocardia neocaledoniensis NBRC 108232]